MKKTLNMASGWLICALAAFVIAPAQAQTVETVLHNFAPVQALTGADPGGLVSDSAGNLYGTAAGGGASFAGVVFKLAASGNETVLYNFTGGADGKNPNPGIVLDSAGNVYGTAVAGGVITGVCGGVTGCGVVFKVDPAGNETVLYSFTGPDGISPNGGVVMDSGGNIYGTTWSGGGEAYAGVVFKVDPTGEETLLHSFTNGADGGGPLAGLYLDAAGNLYGTTRDGGLDNGGVVFKLDASGNETVLYTFQSGADGSQPYASVVLDAAGNIYGATGGTGISDGVIFKIGAAGAFSVLHSFAGGADGSDPGPVIVDPAGNLYGTAYYGGTANAGLVYKIDTGGNKTTLYNFPGGTGGANPNASLLLGPAGSLYGTTAYGGIGNIGVVFLLNASGLETIEYSFPFEGDGADIYGGLAIDAEGNLYGTASTGGAANQGIVYKIDPAGNETVLYAFKGTPDGGMPSTPVTLDSAGNLYGTTSKGGAANSGTVYKLDPAGNETVLYSFQNGTDGGYPQAGVAIDALGDLYGTTQNGWGLVYKLDPTGHETVLYNFVGPDSPNSGLILDSSGNLYGTSADGVYELNTAGQMTLLGSFGAGTGSPDYGVIMDAQGNLYGTTLAYGTSFMGAVYKVSPAGSVTVLSSLLGGLSTGGVIMDAAGSLYGTFGGSALTGSGGGVFKLDAAGNYTELYNFPFWSGPSYGVVRDSSGNLYGTSSTGGTNYTGMVYKLGFASYTICGQVTLQGAALSGVTVTLSGTAGGSATTDTGGNYCFPSSASGNYTVTPFKTGFTFSPTSYSFTNLGVNNVANFTAYPPNYTVSGQVLGPGGATVGGVTIAFSGTSDGSTTTDAFGHYTLLLPPNGNYIITPSLAGYIFTPPSQTYDDLTGNQTANFAANLTGATYTISGLTTLYGNALNGATVMLSGSESGSLTTSGSGNYSFTVTAGGSYTVTAGAGPDYYFYPYPPSSTFSSLSGNQAANFQAAVPSDFNHDGHPDVIWEEPTVGWAQIWYLGGAQGASIINAADLTQANPWQIVGIADFNGDGNPDVVWQDPVRGAVQVWYMGGPSGNQLLGASDITTENPWRVVSVADFNQDGHPDLLWQDPTTGFAQIWYLGGPQGTTLLGAVDLDQANPWSIVGTGDFNGDGVPDVLWQDPVSGTVQIWYMGGTTPGAQGSQLQSAVNLTGPMTTKVVAIADFNLDGHPDVVFQDPVTGAATAYYYTGAQGTIPNGTAALSGANPWYIAGPH